MRIPGAGRQRNGEPIGPLIDVVFLLLLFFMLAGTLTPWEPLRVDPPRSEAADPAGDGVALILLAADGRLALDGRELSRSELREALAGRRAASGEPVVALKADAAAEAAEVIAVLEGLREAGVDAVYLLTASDRP